MSNIVKFRNRQGATLEMKSTQKEKKHENLFEKSRCAAPGSGGEKADDPLAQVVLDMAKRLNTGDLEGSLSYFSDDAITYFIGLPPIGMEICRGKDGIRPIWKDCIDNHFKMVVEEDLIENYGNAIAGPFYETAAAVEIPGGSSKQYSLRTTKRPLHIACFNDTASTGIRRFIRSLEVTGVTPAPHTPWLTSMTPRLSQCLGCWIKRLGRR